MVVVENKEAWEWFQTQTQCLHVYPYLYHQTRAIILQFDQDSIFHIKSPKTVTMV